MPNAKAKNDDNLKYMNRDLMKYAHIGNNKLIIYYEMLCLILISKSPSLRCVCVSILDALPRPDLEHRKKKKDFSIKLY